jgi:hypothetical protein
VVLANNFATIPKMIASLGFGAMSSSWPQVGCPVARLKEGLKESL